VVVGVIDGVSATALTVIVADAALPRPPPELSVAPATWKLPLPKKFSAGVNFKPAPPWATVMKSPLLIVVLPSFWNNEPLVMLVILKKVTSAPSEAFGLIARPDVVWVSSLVVAGV